MAEQKYIGIETMSEIIRRHYVGYGINDMIAELKDNAADVRPAVPGVWLDRGEHEYTDQEATVHLWECSICGKSEKAKSNFCPSCGAVMHLEEKKPDFGERADEYFAACMDALHAKPAEPCDPCEPTFPECEGCKYAEAQK